MQRKIQGKKSTKIKYHSSFDSLCAWLKCVKYCVFKKCCNSKQWLYQWLLLIICWKLTLCWRTGEIIDQSVSLLMSNWNILVGMRIRFYQYAVQNCFIKCKPVWLMNTYGIMSEIQDCPKSLALELWPLNTRATERI